jgi:glycosyltransferase involved in cell wall biosynthesis
MFSTLFCVEEMMVIQPFVSIIVNNYNYDRFLSDSIDSALAQTYQQTEVIVVDDGSVDNSQEIITSYGDRVVAVFKDNGGQASALNAGFAASRGEIICLLDADDAFLPEKVSEVVKLFSSHPDIDWVFTESAPIKATDLVDTKLEDIFKDVLASGSKGLLRKIDFRANLRNAELPNFTPSTSNLCFSRKILEKIFPMPEVKGLSGIAICDTYLNLLAVGLDVGVVTTQNLGIFRLHQNNRFTTQEDNKKRELFSEILLATAYWMRIILERIS